MKTITTLAFALALAGCQSSAPIDTDGNVVTANDTSDVPRDPLALDMNTVVARAMNNEMAAGGDTLVRSRH